MALLIVQLHIKVLVVYVISIYNLFSFERIIQLWPFYLYVVTDKREYQNLLLYNITLSTHMLSYHIVLHYAVRGAVPA